MDFVYEDFFLKNSIFHDFFAQIFQKYVILQAFCPIFDGFERKIMKKSNFLKSKSHIQNEPQGGGPEGARSSNLVD